jgi:branched-chain amino acid transport system substrate-binding protein
MKRAVTVLGLVILVAASVAATAIARPAATAGPASAEAINCRGASLGFAGPLTGPAAFLGQEQLSWSRFAVVQFNRQFKTSFKLVQGDTQLSASLSRTVGRQFVSNANILGVVGPSTSQSVISSAGLFKTAKLAAVSGSATRTDLTTGGKFPTFFRVVPNDFVQAPSIVNFAVNVLKAKKVVVIDSQDDYSTALAKGVTYRFRLKRVTVQRESVANTDTDFSSIVTNVPSDAQVVVFATQTPAAAQTLSNQLREQGKRAVVLGTDGAYSPAQYKPRLGYVSSFAPDIRLVRGGAAIVRAYNAFSKNKTFGTFGPPSYMATWVLMTAINTACRDGAATRAEVTANVKRTNLPSILGGQVRFTAKGDVAGAKFYVFKVTNGKYTLAG